MGNKDELKVEVGDDGAIKVTGRKLVLGARNLELENPIIVIKETGPDLISALLTLASVTSNKDSNTKSIMRMFEGYKEKLEKGKRG